VGTHEGVLQKNKEMIEKGAWAAKYHRETNTGNNEQKPAEEGGEDNRKNPGIPKTGSITQKKGPINRRAKGKNDEKGSKQINDVNRKVARGEDVVKTKPSDLPRGKNGGM